MHLSTIAVLGTTYLAILATGRPSTNAPKNDIKTLSEGPGNHAARINIHTAKLARTLDAPFDSTNLATDSYLTPRKVHNPKDSPASDLGPAYRPGLGKRTLKKKSSGNM